MLPPVGLVEDQYDQFSERTLGGPLAAPYSSDAAPICSAHNQSGYTRSGIPSQVSHQSHLAEAQVSNQSRNLNCVEATYPGSFNGWNNPPTTYPPGPAHDLSWRAFSTQPVSPPPQRALPDSHLNSGIPRVFLSQVFTGHAGGDPSVWASINPAVSELPGEAESRVPQGPPAPPRARVGSPAMRKAGELRRRNPPSFVCELPSCAAKLTTKQGLKSMSLVLCA